MKLTQLTTSFALIASGFAVLRLYQLNRRSLQTQWAKVLSMTHPSHLGDLGFRFVPVVKCSIEPTLDYATFAVVIPNAG